MCVNSTYLQGYNDQLLSQVPHTYQLGTPHFPGNHEVYYMYHDSYANCPESKSYSPTDFLYVQNTHAGTILLASII